MIKVHRRRIRVTLRKENLAEGANGAFTVIKMPGEAKRSVHGSRDDTH